MPPPPLLLLPRKANPPYFRPKMNKSYLIVPAVLLVIFGFMYNGALKEMDAKAVSQQLAADAKRAEAKKHKDEIELKATADAKKRQDEREATDRAREEKKVRAYEDVMKSLRDEGAKYNAEVDKLSKEAQDLEIQIAQARSDKEKLNRETFDLAKEVEQTKINRRNAELEIQRMIEMVGKKLNDSSIAVPPPPVLPNSK
jgi:predicted RNase H-like nuclease (RuvC/YqgF family)